MTTPPNPDTTDPACDEIAKKLSLIFRWVDYVEYPYALPLALAQKPTLAVRFSSAQESLQPQPPHVWSDPARPTLRIEQVELVRALYQGCSTAEQRGYVVERLLCPVAFKMPDTDEKIGQVIAHSLVEVGAVARLPEVGIDKDDWRAWERYWHAVRVKLSLEPHWYSDEALETLESVIKSCAHALPRGEPDPEIPFYRPLIPEASHLQRVFSAISETIARIKYLRLKNELLVGYQPEVEADERLLTSRLGQLGFPPDLEQALTRVHEQMQVGLDFKQCMDLLRSVLERFTELAAERAAQVAGTPLPHASSPRGFKHCKDQLISHKLITTEEAEVIQKLSSYLSQAGVHALSSGPEQVRVCRATVIEWTMMIAGRLQQQLGPPGALPSTGTSPGVP